MRLALLNPNKLLAQFFEKNLFERIIIYVFVSHFLIKLIFELILGQWFYIQSQNQQWIFYGLLAVDYIFSFKKVINLRIKLNPISLFSIILFIMVIHGLYIGIIYHNPPFVIINDMIPILMLALNILRMQSEFEKQEINFLSLFITCTILAAGSCLFGLLAILLHKPSAPSMGDAKIFIPLFLTALIALRPLPIKAIFGCLLIFVLSFNNINRTIMLFMLIVSIIYTVYKIIKNPVFGFLLLGLFIILSTLIVTFLPKDSPTFSRISNIQNIDLNERKGSVGERQAEWEAIQLKLAANGETASWFGLGFGGLYEVKFTHQYLKEYGHAHYSWAWFNFRFGIVGYLYLIILFCCLSFNGIRSFLFYNEVGLFVSMLCLMGVIFLGTHINSLLLLNGIHFLYIKKPENINLNLR